MVVTVVALVFLVLVYRTEAEKCDKPMTSRTKQHRLNLPTYMINLDYRYAAWQRAQTQWQPVLKRPLNRWRGVVGPWLYQATHAFAPHTVTSSFATYLQDHTHHIGHLGAALSHLNLWRHVAQTQSSAVLVLEDDVQPTAQLTSQLDHYLEQLNRRDDQWDVLLLGFSCETQLCKECGDNEGLANSLIGGITPVGYGIGLWAYVINGPRAAQLMLDHVLPLDWCVDHELAAQSAFRNRTQHRKVTPRTPHGLNESVNVRLHHKPGAIRLYGCIPHLVPHPGTFTCSEWSYTAHNPVSSYTSDTN